MLILAPKMDKSLPFEKVQPQPFFLWKWDGQKLSIQKYWNTY